LGGQPRLRDEALLYLRLGLGGHRSRDHHRGNAQANRRRSARGQEQLDAKTDGQH